MDDGASAELLGVVFLEDSRWDQTTHGGARLHLSH